MSQEIEMKKYFAYYRKSSESDERQVLSLEGQKQEVEAKAQRWGLSVAESFEESASAKCEGRKVFSEIVERLAAGEADGLIAWKADRLTRNYHDLAKLVDLVESGIEVWDLFYGHYKNDSTSKFMLAINAAIAKQKIDGMAEDVKRGMKQKVEMGWFPHLAPTGYLNDKVNHTVIQDSERIQHCGRAYELYATGQHTYESIAKVSAEEGFRTQSGKKPKKITIEGILKNPFYCGCFRWGGKVWQGSHKPIVSKELWDRVQDMISGKPCGSPKPQKHTFLYGHQLLVCGECGCSITAERQRKVQKNGNTHEYIYYRCSKSKGQCSQHYVREENLEPQLAEIFSGFRLRQELVDYAQNELQRLYEADNEYQVGVEKMLKNKLANLREGKKALYRKMATGKIQADEEYEGLRAEMQSEVSEIEGKLNSLAVSTNEWLAESSNLLKLCQKAQELFLEGTMEQKRALLGFVASNLYLKGGKVHYDYKKPFDTLSKQPARREWQGRGESNSQSGIWSPVVYR